MAESLIPLPVSQEFARVLFDTVMKASPDDVLLRRIYEDFGLEGFHRFISQPADSETTFDIPERKFWEVRFRDVHIYLVLRTISRLTEPEKWNHTLGRLSRIYSIGKAHVQAAFFRVQAKVRVD